MKNTVLILACAFGAAAQTAMKPAIPVVQVESPAITRQAVVKLEREFDTKISTLWGAPDICDLLGMTRGLRLPGYGVVFSAEVSLVRNPPRLPMGPPQPSAQQIADLHKRKAARIPALEDAMKKMMASAAGAFSTLPADEKIVFAMRLAYMPYEDTAGLPSQIVMTATRAEAASGAVQVNEQ